MKLIAQLRVKNQIFTITECLVKLSDLVDEIVIVDNGSTDGTLKVYKNFPKVKLIEHTIGFDEGRDKRLAHDLAKSLNPDWILWMDGDEIFEESTSRQQLETYMKNPRIDVVQFRMFNFWKSKEFYRVDGLWRRYTAHPQRQMWRNIQSAYFKDLKFHNGGILGFTSKPVTSHIRIKHYGYIYTIQIDKRQKIYNSLKKDPMAIKTLPMGEKGLKLEKWKSFHNKNLQTIYQHSEFVRWNVNSYVESARSLF
jgi:glycosyltransferase involved in cell wall biosynthesis